MTNPKKTPEQIAAKEASRLKKKERRAPFQNASHPGAIAAKSAAIKAEDEKARAKALRAHQDAITADTTTLYRLRYAHIQGDNGLYTTVAYQPPMARNYGNKKVRTGSIYSLSTALQHPNDKFSKATGRYEAAADFANMKSIQLRLPKFYEDFYSYLWDTLAGD